ncbi:MAG: two-component regulator propeller domain-containing protein [bacterium]
MLQRHLSAVTARRLAASAVAATLGIAAPLAAQGVRTPMAIGVPAPSDPYVRESWTVRDGLPVNSVSALLQGRDGYLWLATHDGLVRFDGVRFTVFNAANAPGLPSNRIALLTQARDSTLWLQTEQFQLVRYRHGAFVPIGWANGARPYALVLCEDARGAMWVGTERGLFVVRDTQLVAVAPEAIRGHVTAIAPRRDGSLVVATGSDGIHRVTGTTTGDATHHAASRLTAPNRLDGDSASSMLEDRDGTLWIATGNAVWRLRDSLHAVLHGLATTSVALTEAPLGREIWVGTIGGVWRVRTDPPYGVTRADTRFDGNASKLLFPDQRDRMYWTDGPGMRDGGRTAGPSAGAEVIMALPFGVVVAAAAFDHEGSLWVGTQRQGLYRLKPTTVRVVAHAPAGSPLTNTYPVLQAHDGAMWYGTAAGELVRVLGQETRVFRPSVGRSRWIRTLHEDRAGRLWIGGYGAVVVCTLPELRCAPPPDAGPLASFAGSAMAIHEDPDGTMWVGTDNALFRRDGGRWQQLDPHAGAPTAVRAFLRTRDGALWMGTLGGGVARYHDGVFRSITTRDGLPSDNVRALYEDADGWLWIGTEGRGLARLNPREWAPASGHRGRIASVSTRDGLFDDVIHHIVEDDAGRLWMNGDRGISWVERRALLAFVDGRAPNVVATSYTERDGMRSSEGNGGSQPAGVHARDGTLWFPTQDGVAVVDPARIRRNLAPPPVAVEQIKAQGSDSRDLEIAYTAMSFVAPANVRFRYRLEPYDRDWIDAGARRTAFYTRVPPGHYTFRVIAANNDGVWNMLGASASIDVAPHVWETMAFRLAVLAVLAGFGVAAAQWRVRALRTRTVALERVVDTRTRELRDRNAQLAALHDSRSRLFANLSHEFRTPLTLILGPVRSLLDGRYGPTAPALREQAELMQRNGQRLLRLINQVLDLARLQAGAVTLDLKSHDLAAFARATTLAFAPLAERRRIALAVRTDEGALPVSFDAEQLEKVLLNLLSNALKFTEPGGAVEITVARDGHAAVVRVRDTGVGIAREQVERVFDRFFQGDASATRRYEGTGIGLALAKELVELHGGTIDVASTPGEGSTFTVRLPIGNVADDATPFAHSTPVARADADTHEAALAFAPVAEATVSAADSIADRTTVLLVDDNADVRAFVRSLLSDAYRVIEAADGRQGLAAARAELPDLIVADVMMPELDGLSLGRALKSDAMTDAIPLVLLSARAATEDQVAGLETGADAYLLKPFDPPVLIATVDGLLAQRRRLRERFRAGAEAIHDSALAAPASEPTAAEPPAIVRKLRPLVEARLTDPALDPNELAAAAGLSYHQMYRALRDEVGVSPSRFIRTVRVECAAELLKRGAGSVTEIAYSVGFESLSYFSRAFSERFDVAPSVFAKGRS